MFLGMDGRQWAGIGVFIVAAVGFFAAFVDSVKHFNAFWSWIRRATANRSQRSSGTAARGNSKLRLKKAPSKQGGRPPPDDELVILYNGKELSSWSVETGNIIQSFGTNYSLPSTHKTTVQPMPQRGVFAFVCYGLPRIPIFDAHSGTEIAYMEHGHDLLRQFELSQNGRFILTAGYSEVRLWNATSLKMIKEFRRDLLNDDLPVALSSDSEFLAIPSHKGVRVVRRRNGRTIGKEFNVGQFDELHFSNDNRTLVVRSRGSIRLYDIFSQVMKYAPSNYSMNSSALVRFPSVDGLGIFYGGFDEKVRLISPVDGKIFFETAEVGFVPDNGMISRTTDAIALRQVSRKAVGIWHPPSQEIASFLEFGEREIRSAAFC